MDIARVINKPPLFHYTSPEGFLGILSTRSLWSSPTWAFPDTRECVLGLELILGRLKRIGPQSLESQGFPLSTLSLMKRHGVEPRRVLDQLIPQIEHELANPKDPRLQVYVACVTENNQSCEMAQHYGRCVMRLNWMLPIFAYAWPRTFVFSTLSRVSYDKAEFDRWIMRGLDFAMHVAPAHHEQFLAQLAPAERKVSCAITAAILLCSLATNIKEPQFAFEREWRLKTVRSLHTAPTPFTQEVSQMRRWLGVSDDASFTTHQPARYIQELALRGKLIVQGNIGIATPPPRD